MKSRRMLALCALAALALTTTPALADPVDDLLVQLDDTAYATVQRAAGTIDKAVAVDPPAVTTTKTLDYWTDAISILDWGSGPTVTYGGVFRNSNWWSCSHGTSTGGSVVVTCNAVPNSGINWQCGVMHVNATVYSRPVDGYDWVRDYGSSAQATRSRASAALPAAPDPSKLRWGKAVGRVSCDGSTLMTPQADQSNTSTSATAAMGAVTTLVCEARLSQTSATQPVRPYSVNCVDPANPTKTAVS